MHTKVNKCPFAFLNAVSLSVFYSVLQTDCPAGIV
uniref:Uncharacterized protein n=1 Tax=Phakopsora pachyrhizi TaxID=170000 RepID=A0A0S1MK20_PHAPC